MLLLKWQLPMAHEESYVLTVGTDQDQRLFWKQALIVGAVQLCSQVIVSSSKGYSVRRSQEKAEGDQLKKSSDSHNLTFSKILALEILTVVKNVPFKVTYVLSDPVHHRRG